MTAAVIPTRYRPPELAALLAVLEADGVRAIVLDSEDHGHAIHAMWNVGVSLAAGEGACAVLNDDVALPRGAVPAMAAALLADPSVGVVYPDVSAPWGPPRVERLEPTTGTWGAGGMTGFAFVLRLDPPPPPFDEGYGWWYGDDAFEEAVRQSGLSVCRAVGVPVRHEAGRSAGRDWARLGPLVAADRARWEARA